MTETTDTATPTPFGDLPLVPDLDLTPETPELLEELLRDQYLNLICWRVGRPERIDEEDEHTDMIADLSVIYTNGRRWFRSERTFLLDVIYGLVGHDGIYGSVAQECTAELIEHAEEVSPQIVEPLRVDQEWAFSLNPWEHTDADLIRAAAATVPNDFGTLLGHCADLVESLPPIISFSDPAAQVAAISTKIALDLL